MKLQTILSLILLAGSSWLPTAAQEPVAPPVAVEKTPEALRDDQLAISGRYARFERMLSQMADILGRQDPERADLLRRAIGKGREDRISEDIEKIVALLEKHELGGASEQQAEVIESLQVLLKLLQSEDRRSSVERERERLNGLLKDVRTVITEQRSARAATRNAEAPSSAAPGQQKALSETEKLLDSMREHDDEEAKEADAGEPSGEPKDGASKDDESRDGEPKAGQPKDSEPSEGSPENGDQKPNDDKQPTKDDDPTKSKTPSTDAQQSEGGRSKSGQQNSGRKPSKQSPGREQLEKAREQMQQALEALKQQKRDEAVKDEDQALEELHAAAAKLEEMLKQLREEEKEMMLAALEARFQRMLMAETQIHEGTVSLAATPQKDWLDQYYSRCRELAQQQSELTQECAQTVNLLREDGSSASILLAVEDIEADMGSVTGWLQESTVTELTQSVQTDILESLRQLIEATQQEMQEMKEHEQQQQQQQNSQEKPGLVKLMAEIRMLRTLQLQVNRRTKQLDGLMQSVTTEDQPALRKQLHELAVRQQRLIVTAKELAKQAE